MKIVDGKPFAYEFECRTCKSKLVAEPQDVKVGDFGGGYGGDSPSREYYVTCVVCDTDRMLKYDEVPPKVRTMAHKSNRRRS